MLKVKDTLRATVHLSFDGRVFKAYHGLDATKRFANEVRVCAISPRAAAISCPACWRRMKKNCRIITTNCGTRVEHIDEEGARDELFTELNSACDMTTLILRNITYRFADGRFCLIDFEFATILPQGNDQNQRLEPTQQRFSFSHLSTGPKTAYPRRRLPMVRLHGHRPGPQEQRGRLSRPAV